MYTCEHANKMDDRGGKKISKLLQQSLEIVLISFHALVAVFLVNRDCTCFFFMAACAGRGRVVAAV